MEAVLNSYQNLLKEMKTFKHIVFTRFDVHCSTKQDKDWLKYRFEIFKKYTLKGLLNQTNRDFVLWIRYASDFYDEAQELNKYLETTGIKCFFTYFDGYTEKGIDELNKYVEGVDLVLETRIDSDDIYNPIVIDEIQKQEHKESQIFIYLDGYLYQESTKKLWNYYAAGPFYTCVYPTEIFIDKTKKKLYYSFLPAVQTYEGVDVREMTGKRFVVVVHDKNCTNIRYNKNDVNAPNMQSGSMLYANEGSQINKGVDAILKEYSII